MHVRRKPSVRADGSTRTELSLAYNVRVTAPDGGSVPKPVIVAKLGIEEELAIEDVDEMIAALVRYRAKRTGGTQEGPATPPLAESATATEHDTASARSAVGIVATRQLGLRVVVEEAWRDLGLHELFHEIEKRSCRTLPFEKLVSAMVVNRLADPMSKLACDAWVKEHAYFPDADAWDVEGFYRAMDLLDARGKQIADHVMRTVVAKVPAEERARLLLDTTNCFMASEMDDEQRAEIGAMWEAYERGDSPSAPVDPKPQVVNDPPLRMRGHSKDRRNDAPLVTMALLTTRKGTVLWHDVHPGNASEKQVMRDTVKEVIARHPDEEVICVMDAGMAGRPNLAWLAEQSPKLGWLVGVPVRQNKHVEAALRKAGRWTSMSRRSREGAWSVRAVDLPAEEWVDPKRPERLILVRNPARARRDWRKLDRDLKTVKAQLARDPSPAPRGATALRMGNPNRSRLVKWNGERGRLSLDKARVRREHQLLGLRAMRTTMTDTADAVIASYDDLLNIEAQFRTFKSPLKLRPMHHRRASRIRAHAMIVFLAVACAQHIARRSGQRWDDVKAALRGIDAVQMSQGGRTWWQRTQWGREIDEMLRSLGIASAPERWASNAGFLVKRVRRTSV